MPSSRPLPPMMISAVSLLLLLLAETPVARSEVFRILTQGAAAAGQGAAFAAQADDPSAIYYNPAGMTQLQGVQLYAGTALIGGSTRFVNAAGATATGNLDGSIAFPPPSNFYVTANLKSLGVNSLGDLTVGLGVISRFGLLTRYPNDGPFATAVTLAALPLLDIKPTLAYRVNDKLSVGLGADIYTFASFLGQGQLELNFNWPGGGGIPPGTPVEVNGNGTTAGFNLSLLYTPFRNGDEKPLANIGFQYRSQAVLPLRGQFLVNGAPVADASSSLRLPQVFTGAMAIWPIRDREREWKLEMDVDYVGWHSFRNLDVQLSNGATLPFPQNWNNNFVWYFGTEHKWLRLERFADWELALRAGYWYSQTPVPDGTFNPAVPDANNQTVSIGLGVLCKGTAAFLGVIPCGHAGWGALSPSAIGLDLAYQVLLYEPRTVSGNRNPTVDGTYKTTLHVGSVNVRVTF